MRIVTAKEMAELDRHTIEDLKIPSLELMENAGYAVAKEASFYSKIVVICGKGNNGGDGLVAARYLAEEFKKSVKIILVGHKNEVNHDPKINMERLKLDVYEAPDHKTFLGADSDLKECDLIIDAIFGIGLNAELKPPHVEIITSINSLQKNVLAVDIPSGLNATTGEVMGAAVKASKTVTFAAAKAGLYKNEGPKYAGDIVVVDIGIPV